MDNFGEKTYSIGINYVDKKMPALLRMYGKRLKGYSILEIRSPREVIENE